MTYLMRLIGALTVTLFATFAQADDGGPGIVLTVSGLAEDHTFSIADLSEIGEESFSTTTIWTDGLQVFTGVPLNQFLAFLGVSDGIMVAAAINDYAIDFPVADALQDGPMIAYLRNGKEMPVRDKGPLWIVYPYDANADFQSEIVHSRSIWQLHRIEFRTE